MAWLSCLSNASHLPTFIAFPFRPSSSLSFVYSYTMAGPKLKKFPKFIGSRPYTDIKIEKSTEKTRISLGESQAASRKKEPTTGIPPRLWAHLIPPVPVVTSTVYRHYAKGKSVYGFGTPVFIIDWY